jgi:hypothetical protein
MTVHTNAQTFDQTISQPANQPTDKSIYQSSELAGIFSFLPFPTDITANSEDEQPLRKRKKKKKGRRIN